MGRYRVTLSRPPAAYEVEAADGLEAAKLALLLGERGLVAAEVVAGVEDPGGRGSLKANRRVTWETGSTGRCVRVLTGRCLFNCRRRWRSVGGCRCEYASGIRRPSRAGIRWRWLLVRNLTGRPTLGPFMLRNSGIARGGRGG
jgi:hypothetical protein